MYFNITSDLESNPVQSPMEVGFWIWDFQVFKAKVQTIVEFMGRKVKIWISSGKDSHGIVKLFSDIAAWDLEAKWRNRMTLF